MKKNNLITPKTYFYIEGQSRPLKMYLSPHRARLWVMRKARELLNLHKNIRVRVVYGKEECVFGCKCIAENEETYDNFQELRQATYAFLEERLWIKK